MWSYPGGGWWGYSYHPTWPTVWPNRTAYFHMPAPPAPKAKAAADTEVSSDTMSPRETEKEASPLEEVAEETVAAVAGEEAAPAPAETPTRGSQRPPEPCGPPPKAPALPCPPPPKANDKARPAEKKKDGAAKEMTEPKRETWNKHASKWHEPGEEVPFTEMTKCEYCWRPVAVQGLKNHWRQNLKCRQYQREAGVDMSVTKQEFLVAEKSEWEEIPPLVRPGAAQTTQPWPQQWIWGGASEVQECGSQLSGLQIHAQKPVLCERSKAWPSRPRPCSGGSTGKAPCGQATGKGRGQGHSSRGFDVPGGRKCCFCPSGQINPRTCRPVSSCC